MNILVILIANPARKMHLEIFSKIILSHKSTEKNKKIFRLYTVCISKYMECQILNRIRNGSFYESKLHHAVNDCITRFACNLSIVFSLKLNLEEISCKLFVVYNSLSMCVILTYGS